MINLGLCYEKGTGIQQDYNKAFELYQKAANSGHPQAQNNLASCYYFGMGVAKDVPMAKMYYEKAAAQGNENAKRNLSVLKF